MSRGIRATRIFWQAAQQTVSSVCGIYDGVRPLLACWTWKIASDLLAMTKKALGHEGENVGSPTLVLQMVSSGLLMAIISCPTAMTRGCAYGI